MPSDSIKFRLTVILGADNSKGHFITAEESVHFKGDVTINGIFQEHVGRFHVTGNRFYHQCTDYGL